MSNTEALPPLPEPPTPAEWLHHMYSADQMRAYALAALAQPKTIAKWWAAKQAASGEPVAWTYTGIKADGSEHGPHLVWNPAYMDAMSASKGAQATPLYAAPQPAPARVPRTLTEEQLERHGISASECPPNSQVMLVSSIRRLLGYAGTPAKEAP